MAAINGANMGLGLVTLGLETDFPEDARNTDPGVAAVSHGTTYKIRNVDKTGTNVENIAFGAGPIAVTGITETGRRLGPGA